MTIDYKCVTGTGTCYDGTENECECWDCAGTGGASTPCNVCNGTGIENEDDFYKGVEPIECQNCHGHGNIPTN